MKNESKNTIIFNFEPYYVIFPKQRIEESIQSVKQLPKVLNQCQNLMLLKE